MRSVKRPDTLLSAVVTTLAPALLILVALIVAIVVPRHATIIILGGTAVAATVFYLLSRSRTSRGVRAGAAPRQQHGPTRHAADARAHRWPVNGRFPEAADKTVERVT
jgi:hypothetical protein